MRAVPTHHQSQLVPEAGAGSASSPYNGQYGPVLVHMYGQPNAPETVDALGFWEAALARCESCYNLQQDHAEREHICSAGDVQAQDCFRCHPAPLNSQQDSPFSTRVRRKNCSHEVAWQHHCNRASVHQASLEQLFAANRKEASSLRGLIEGKGPTRCQRSRHSCLSRHPAAVHGPGRRSWRPSPERAAR